MEKITSFRDEYRFLSNIFQYPFVFKGLQYPNAEAAFQAQKCTNNEDKIKYTKVKNPVRAKQMGKKEPGLRKDWDLISVNIMLEIERAKFAVTSLEFTDAIYKLMNWDRGNRYKVLGRIANSAEGLILVFDLEEARLYNALKRENVPITFYNGGTISKYLNGEGKVGIVPCFDSPSDYFYGGFADKDVGEFINLPDEKYNDLIHKAQWEPLVEVRLKGKDM